MLYQLSYVRVQASLARRRFQLLAANSPESRHARRSRADFGALADDYDGRADVHVLEQPLRVGDVHPDATVRR